MKPSKLNPGKCPYFQGTYATISALSSNLEQKPMATSPKQVLSNTSRSQPLSKTPPQHRQGWRNLMAIQKGAHNFFTEMAALTDKTFFEVKVGPKKVYLITNGELAETLLEKYGKHLGRGDILRPFTKMVGPVFFASDEPWAADTRKVFLNTVTRLEENFHRIMQINERTFTSTQLTEGHIPDLFAFVAWHTIGCIAACFIGTDDLSAISSDTHNTFLKATRQIAQASMDPLSRLIHPCLRSGFREASIEMGRIAHQLLDSNIDAICKGNNYIWDLAIFRAQQLHPDMNFDDCTHFELNNAEAAIVRDLVENDRFVLEHGPLTIFASANVGATLFYLLDVLSNRPDIIENMRSEMARVLGDQPFTYEHLGDLPYVRAVIQEALWQATPIPTFPREVLSSFQTSMNNQSVSFQKGDMLMLLFRPMQGRDREFSPKLWFDDNNNPSPTLFAFGTGHRRCPARPFAEQMLTQFLVTMISHNLHIVLSKRPTYTTRNGNLGPDYQPQQPVTAEVRPLPVELHARATARL